MVPLIFFTIVALLWEIPKAQWMGENTFINWATIIMLPVLYFYYTLSFSIMLGMLIFTACCLLASYALDLYLPVSLWSFSLGVFSVAWVFQFIGHKIEGAKPSFDDIKQTLEERVANAANAATAAHNQNTESKTFSSETTPDLPNSNKSLNN